MNGNNWEQETLRRLAHARQRKKQADDEAAYWWEAHHIDSNPNNDSLINCRILCWPCHEKTF